MSWVAGLASTSNTEMPVTALLTGVGGTPSAPQVPVVSSVKFIAAPGVLTGASLIPVTVTVLLRTSSLIVRPSLTETEIVRVRRGAVRW